jgi:hypothetical protein
MVYVYNMCFNPVFLCFYVQSFAAIKQNFKETISKSSAFLLYIPENITAGEVQNSEFHNIKKMWYIFLYFPCFKGLGEE